MGHRKIAGLRWALRATSPWPSTRARGAKAQGLRYERAIGAMLPDDAEHNPWFEFADDNGGGFCSPDFLLSLGDRIVIVESKYTWVPEGHTQLAQLYKPVVEMALRCKTIGVLVCRHLSPAMPGNVQVCGSLPDAVSIALSGGTPLWHNLACQLRPRKRPRAARGAFGFVQARMAL